MKKELTPEKKEAKRLYQIEYRKKNKGKVKVYAEQQKEYRKEWKKKDYEANKEQHRENRLKYYHDTAELRKAKQKEYKKKNRKKLAEYQKQYYKKRREADPIFKLRDNVRRLFQQCFRRNNHKKTSKTIDILGCSIETFKQYIEVQFESWMSWDNYGLYNGGPNYGWDIDHIIPISTAITVEDIIRLNHHTNLQPLCSYYNRDIKKAKLS